MNRRPSAATALLVVVLMLGIRDGHAQRLDPDWNVLARDSRDHVLAGGLVGVGARLVLPTVRTWQRLAVCGTIALAYELGQEGVARNSNLRGRGFGIGLKDLTVTVAGCSVVELLWRHRRVSP